MLHHKADWQEFGEKSLKYFLICKVANTKKEYQ